MASVVDICNLAIANLGEEAIVQSIETTDGTVQSALCERFYPIARDALLARHHWNFATTAITPAPLAETPRQPWAAKYSLPSNIIAVQAVEYSPKEYSEFKCENGVLLTQWTALNIFVTLRIEDPTKFSPLFTEALGFQLATHLAGPIIKGKNGMQVAKEMRQQAETVISWAKEQDSNEMDDQTSYTPKHIKDRGYVEYETNQVTYG